MAGKAGEQTAVPAPADAAVGHLLAGIGCYIFLSSAMQSLASLQGAHAGLSGLSLGLALVLASGGLGAVTDMAFAISADRRGTRRVAQTGVALGMLAAILLLAPGRAALFVGCFVFGLGTSALGNPLLSWLGSARRGRALSKVQGLNGSVQRFGALLAAAVVGIAIALGRPVVIAGAGLVISALGWTALSRAPSAARPPQPEGARNAAKRLSRRDWLRDYRRGVSMLAEPGIALAGLVSLAINMIFLETNSYVPLLHAPHRALIVTGTLVARDAVAIGVGMAIARTGVDVSAPATVASALGLAGLSALAGGLGAGGAFFVLWGAIQGGVVGLCIAATNLFAIGATRPEDRTMGMAASFLPARIMFIVLPLGCSYLLHISGLSSVFCLLGSLTLMLAVVFLALHRSVAVA